ncbi:caspase family protein [Arcicella rigui]|uniref:Caspase family protein n=1 Tax=Arcicella rigui TaxID=797020 RepID=A0ABU5Q7S6_9BACT|nr:caspase family protein [Arcicella rigui]MEA5138627.1 caspase family protein [Arcicella rigui]
MNNKFALIFIICLTQFHGIGQTVIKLNTIQLKGIEWIQPSVSNETIFQTNNPKINIECKAICEAPLEANNFKVWLDGQSIFSESICLNNTFKTSIEVSPNYTHELFVTVEKGKKLISTSTLKIFFRPTQKRVALLIGNSDYKHGTRLGENPINDANDMGQTLQSLGFDVKVITNGTLQTIKDAIKTFQEKIKGAEMATFFFAGHGIEINGKKYIIPVDAQLKTPADANDDAYNIETLFERLKSGNAKHNLIILDACRNDPFKEVDILSKGEERAWSNTDRGFSAIELNNVPSGNIYLAMATGWGKKAQNGTGRNGVYTGQLLKQIKSGERLEKVFDRTGINVKEETKQKQNPQFLKEPTHDNEFVF